MWLYYYTDGFHCKLLNPEGYATDTSLRISRTTLAICPVLPLQLRSDLFLKSKNYLARGFDNLDVKCVIVTSY